MLLQYRDIIPGSQQDKIDGQTSSQPSHSLQSLSPDSPYQIRICGISPLNPQEEKEVGLKKTKTGGKKGKRASFPSSAGVKQKGTSMLIGDLISVLILQLCATEESSRLFFQRFFFLNQQSLLRRRDRHSSVIMHVIQLISSHLQKHCFLVLFVNGDFLTDAGIFKTVWVGPSI